MPTDKPSTADLDLVARLRAAGVANMTWRKLKRWRKEGLVPDPVQVHAPGVRGSSSSYADDTFEQALTLARILTRHRSFAKAALLLFARGYAVEARAIQAGLVSGLDWFDAEIARHAPGVDTAEVPQAVAHAIVARAAPQSRKSGFLRGLLTPSTREHLENAFAYLIGVYLGTSQTAAGGLLAAQRQLGQDLRASEDLDEARFALVMNRIDERLREARDAGGLGAQLRSIASEIHEVDTVALRERVRDFVEFCCRLRLPTGSLPPFIQEVVGALAQPSVFSRRAGFTRIV